MELTEDTLNKIKQLAEKYSTSGQDLNSYLEGLLHTDYLSYWDYIHLDTLLSLQNPRTSFPDEKIFIIYHQITELYFRLILSEMEQICTPELPEKKTFLRHLRRITAYFKNLTQSFDVMVNGMDPKQFLSFRMALLPASGFQSAQYRMIEIMSTSLENLVHNAYKPKLSGTESPEELYAHTYWKYGNIEIQSGKKTLTLTMFEQKYDKILLELGEKLRDNHILAQYHRLNDADRQDPEVIQHLKMLDLQSNVFWPLSHYKSAVKYLQKDPEDIKATGGTNWQKYLPPRFQRIISFPELWSENEKNEWGKAWVLELFNEQVEQFWK